MNVPDPVSQGLWQHIVTSEPPTLAQHLGGLFETLAEDRTVLTVPALRGDRVRAT